MKKVIFAIAAVAFVATATESMAARGNTRLGADQVTCPNGKKVKHLAGCKKIETNKKKYRIGERPPQLAASFISRDLTRTFRPGGQTRFAWRDLGPGGAFRFRCRTDLRLRCKERQVFSSFAASTRDACDLSKIF